MPALTPLYQAERLTGNTASTWPRRSNGSITTVVVTDRTLTPKVTGSMSSKFKTVPQAGSGEVRQHPVACNKRHKGIGMNSLNKRHNSQNNSYRVLASDSQRKIPASCRDFAILVGGAGFEPATPSV